MKSLRLALCLSLVTLAAAISTARAADSDQTVRILVAKTSDPATACVTIGDRTFHVPIDIESGLSWDDVKDGYHLPPAYAELMKQGRVKIFITCSGTSFHVIELKRKWAASFGVRSP